MSRAKFTDRVTVEELPKMPDEYRDLVIRLLTIQADCEIGGPHVYGQQWFLDAPTADDMFRLTHILAEEIDHFRKFAGLLQKIGIDRSDLLRRRPADRFLEAFQVTDVSMWADVATFCCLVDRVGRYQLEEMAGSSYQPLDGVLPTVMAEEVGHIGYGTARLGELARDPETRLEAQAAVNHWYPRALDMFGRTGSSRAEQFIEWGLKKRANEEARAAYIAEVDPLLDRMGLVVPDPSHNRHYL
ncbi:MAG TPA: Phenylacetic acid catabolic protein [Chloroflexota bacterium]